MPVLSRIFKRRLKVVPPFVHPRRAWAPDMPTGPIRREEDVRFLLVHHTGSRNNYRADEVPEILRTIYRNHTGAYSDHTWPDIAYNFMIDKYGRIWEGRSGSLDGPIRGDATGGSQGHAILACWLGNHKDEAPTEEAQNAMVHLLAWQASLYRLDVAPGAQTSFLSRGSSRWPVGANVSTATIAGHRDMSETTCPGDAGYEIVHTLQRRVSEFLR